MLEEKLKKAQQHGVKQRRQVLAGLLVVLCLGALLVVGLPSLDFVGKNEKPDAVPKNLASVESAIKSETDLKPPVAAKTMTKSVPAVKTQKLIFKAPKSVTDSEPEVDQEKNRSEFKERLRQYENGLEVRLRTSGVELWNPDTYATINELKTTALKEFSNGDFSKALDNLQLLESSTSGVLEEAERLFAENLEKAALFLADDIYDKASFHIKKALLVNAQSLKAQAIQREIEKLPYILPLLDGVKIARVENDLQKEYGFLEQLLQAAPKRRGVALRMKVVASQIRKEKFDSHISQGFRAIDKREAEKAAYHYLEAGKVDPGRGELKLLAARLQTLKKSLRVEAAIERAEQAVRRDDWQQARDFFSRAKRDAPENPKVVEGLRRSQLVLGLVERFKQYFKDPYRLNSTVIRREVEQTLLQAETAAKYSFNIKRQVEKLAELVIKLNRPVSVTVISDNKTFITVRRVGRVGVVSQKTVELKPGRYVFEGARDGYKSKLVQVLIPYEQNSATVRVMCDEPI